MARRVLHPKVAGERKNCRRCIRLHSWCDKSSIPCARCVKAGEECIVDGVVATPAAAVASPFLPASAIPAPVLPPQTPAAVPLQAHVSQSQDSASHEGQSPPPKLLVAPASASSELSSSETLENIQSVPALPNIDELQGIQPVQPHEIIQGIQTVNVITVVSPVDNLTSTSASQPVQATVASQPLQAVVTQPRKSRRGAKFVRFAEEIQGSSVLQADQSLPQGQLRARVIAVPGKSRPATRASTRATRANVVLRESSSELSSLDSSLSPPGGAFASGKITSNPLKRPAPTGNQVGEGRAVRSCRITGGTKQPPAVSVAILNGSDDEEIDLYGQSMDEDFDTVAFLLAEMADPRRPERLCRGPPRKVVTLESLTKVIFATNDDMKRMAEILTTGPKTEKGDPPARVMVEVDGVRVPLISVKRCLGFRRAATTDDLLSESNFRATMKKHLVRSVANTMSFSFQEGSFYSKASIKLNMPDHLKSMLVDDWENVTKQSQVVPLPAKFPVNTILDEYFESEKTKRLQYSVEMILLEEVIAGLKTYFDKCLGRILLYSFERPQYTDLSSDWNKDGNEANSKGPGDTYGAEHLARLLVSLPELIAQTNMDQQSVQRLREEMHQFTNWLCKQENVQKYFTSEYETPDQVYIDRALHTAR